jgi:hypothetical protein
MEVTDSGEVVRFTGGVVLNIVPEKAEAKQ